MHPVDKHNRDEYVRQIEARLAEAMMYLRECHSLLTEPDGGFVPGGLTDFLRAADSASRESGV